MAGTADRSDGRSLIDYLSDPRWRGRLVQVALIAVVVWLGWEFLSNARQNLAAQKIATGFGFLGEVAGFQVSQSLIPYSESATYGRAFVVGLLNTLLVSALGIVFATIIGFAIGAARLSANPLLARLAGAYVETLRNLPLLFQILFWYLAVLGTFPGPRESSPLFGAIYLTNRGVLVPRLLADPWVVSLVILLVAIAVAGAAMWLRRRTYLAGGRTPWRLVLAAGLSLLALLLFLGGGALPLEYPELRGFNFAGGFRINPEFLALLFALSTYTASFIAEIVRAGFLAVPRGQFEAAASLGLRPQDARRLIIRPQALRVIVPPLTSQYLNLTKNSSLAAAIGYPDFFYVFAGTTLNQTGQAIEIIAVTMAVYLAISLVTSLFMNWYNRAVALRGG